MNKKIVLPLAALATSIILTACGTSAPAPASTHTAAAATSAATASHAPTPAFAASPTGIWNIAYTSAPASILGQYTITENGGFYDMTTKTVLKMPDAGCSLPPGTAIGTFSSTDVPGGFSGTENLYEQGTCAPATSPATGAFTVTISGNTMILLTPNAEPTSVTLTRVGASSVAATTPAVTPSPSMTPVGSPSATGCLVPDLIGDSSASAAAFVHNAGLQSVLTAKVFPGDNQTVPGNFPAGFVWGTNPPVTTRVPCGSTVTVYFQPSSS